MAAVPPQTRWGKLGDALAARGKLLDTYQVSYALFSSDFARQLLNRSVNGEAPRRPASREVAQELGGLIGGGRPLPAVCDLELRCFLGERLLRDTDAASMASSLEVRVPLLDHEVVSAACALERQRSASSRSGRKQVLRDIALDDLDPALFDRPKSGFVLPIDRWARNALKEEMTTALHDPDVLRSGGARCAAPSAGSGARSWSPRAACTGRASGRSTCSAGGVAHTG